MIEEPQNIIVGSESVQFDAEYAQWIAELAKRYRQSQIKASVKVNDEMHRFYSAIYISAELPIRLSLSRLGRCHISFRGICR